MSPQAPSPTTAIAVAEPHRVIVRGRDLCADFIGHTTFTGYFLTLIDAPADDKLLRLVDACMVAIAEHGLVPSVQAARMTHAAAPDSLQGAVAAGLLGCGPVILGASESAGLLLADIVATADGDDPGPAALRAITMLRAERRVLPGFGHPIHKPVDPRATRLIELSRELGSAGAYVAALEAIEAAVPQIYEKPLPINVSGAIAAVLLDAGFPIGALKGIPLIARVAGLVAHLLEEQRRPIGFRLADLAAAGIPYAGSYPGQPQTGSDP